MEKQIAGFPDYFVHSDGYVISRKNGKEHRLVGCQCNGGKRDYMQVTLRHNGIQVGKAVHRLVAENFIERKVGKNQVNHKDGNKLNNNIENLEWVSAKENMSHAVKTGLWKSPTDNHYKKMRTKAWQRLALFTMEEASDLMEMKAALRLSCPELAAIVGCNKKTIQNLDKNATIHFINGSVI